MTRLFGQISEPLTASLGVESWIASLAAIRAKISRSPASEQALQELVDQFGKTLIESLVKSAQRCAFSRMSQATFGWGSEPSDEISKTEAIAFRRAYSRRKKLVRRTSDCDSSSWRWMTARTSRGGYQLDATTGEQVPTLQGQATNWPTPDSALMNNRESPETFEARRAALAVKHRNGNGAGTPLGMAVLQWPTPNTGESLTGHGRRGGKANNGSQSGESLEAVATAAGPTQWATPRSSMADNGTDSGSAKRQKQGENIGLKDQAKQFLTPKSSDTRSGQVSPTTLAKNSRPLTEIACQHGRLPEATPLDGEQSSPSTPDSPQPSRKLNAEFVCWLMGFPPMWTGPQVGTTNSECLAMRSYLSAQHHLLRNYLLAITRLNRNRQDA